MSWYLGSMGERDTHHGGVVRPIGTVAADYGVEVEPLLLPLGSLAPREGPTDPARPARNTSGSPIRTETILTQGKAVEVAEAILAAAR